MIPHMDVSDATLRSKIKAKLVSLGGNKNLKIYGELDCKSGQRMKRENRVFFASEKEAIKNNFRPCGHCMRSDYKKWKNGVI
ncbi:MAG: Ada metal-binding domain-containing protein [Maribacter sp.]